MSEHTHDIQTFKKQFLQALNAAQSKDALEHVRLTFLSRKGSLATLMHQLKTLSPEQKRTVGPTLNALKRECEQLFTTKARNLTIAALKKAEQQHAHFDVTAYHPNQEYGTLHPLTQVTRDIEDSFMSMGYTIVTGPEVETERYNFEALNIPADHPARDMQDTFWLNVPGLLLRTHTSPVQIHAMEKQKPPIALLATGRCFRHEATDASHDIMFSQAEGLFIDTGISIGNLIATARTVLQKLFGKKKLSVRTRPGYFPFVEPGIELDMSCPFCKTGCSVCKHTRWIEMMGAGLVHPNVLKHCNIDPEQYSGFAFGLGLTRVAMLRYGINDIRLLHRNKKAFLKQF